MWDLDGEPSDWPIAQAICNTACTVRQDCLLDALKVLAEPAIGQRSDIDVIRGGIRFKQGKPRSQCLLCTLYVCNTPEPSICYVCRKYTPCEAKCGRGVLRRTGAKFCEWCEKDMAEEGRLAT